MSQKIIPTTLALFAITLLCSACSFTGSQEASSQENTPKADQAKSDKIIQDLLQEVSKVMVLPAGENPTVFDITDPEVLTSHQAFFKGSVKGDKLIIYPVSAKAIIYSPSRKIIVNVGPLTFDSKNTEQKGTAPVTAPTVQK